MLQRRLSGLGLAAAMLASVVYACGGDNEQTSASTASSGQGGSSNNGSNSSGTSSGGTTSTGSGLAGGGPVDCEDPPLLETDIVPIFENSCGSGDDICHSRVAFGADVSFDCRGWLSLENDSIGSLFYDGPNVGQSTGCPDMDLMTRLLKDAWQCGPPGVSSAPLVPYVVPCEPEASYLIHKMTNGMVGGPICQDQDGMTWDPMPPDQQPNMAEIELVYDWIAAGAPTLANPGCRCGNGEGGGGGAGGSGSGPQDPMPFIDHPGDMETRPANMPVPFIGIASDPQDGTIPGSSLYWYSNLDGALNGGTPAAMFNQVLSVGTHIITLEAEDSDSNIGSAQITVFIVP